MQKNRKLKAFIVIAESKFFPKPWVANVFVYGGKKKKGESFPDFAGDTMSGAYMHAREFKKKHGQWMKMTIKKGFVSVKI